MSEPARIHTPGVLDGEDDLDRSLRPRTLAREGLVGLGYSPQEVDRLLDEVEGDSAEDLIAEALRAAR